MINLNIVRKYSAYMILSVLPLATFMMTLIPLGLLYSSLTSLGVIILSIILSNHLLKNSFTELIEGKGLLTINLDSKGVLGFTVLGLNTKLGKIQGNIGNNSIDVKYESNLIHTMPAPNKMTDGYYIKNVEGKDKLVVDFEHFRQFRFGFEQYPVLIYNSISGQLLTKDYLGDKEKGLVSHLVYNANEIGKSLNRSMLNFSRAVAEADREIKPVDIKTILVWIFGAIIFGAVCYMLWQTFFSASGGEVISTVSSSLIIPTGG